MTSDDETSGGKEKQPKKTTPSKSETPSKKGPGGTQAGAELKMKEMLFMVAFYNNQGMPKKVPGDHVRVKGLMDFFLKQEKRYSSYEKLLSSGIGKYNALVSEYETHLKKKAEEGDEAEKKRKRNKSNAASTDSSEDVDEEVTSAKGKEKQEMKKSKVDGSKGTPSKGKGKETEKSKAEDESPKGKGKAKQELSEVKVSKSDLEDDED